MRQFCRQCWLWAALSLVLTVTATVSSGVAMALALWTHSGWVTIAFSLIVYAALSIKISHWVTGKSTAHLPSYSHRVAIDFSAVTTLLFAGLLLIPRSIPAAVPPAIAQEWQLPNGSRIAYVHLSVTDRASLPQPPIVFLHGGPGIGLNLESDLNFFASFAAAGYSLYKYDQIGSGFSGRLAEVRRYTIDRQVEDLELIRQQIGADRLILWGQSWGGSLAQNYLARYPNRVSKLILTSSGAPWWSWQPDPIQWAALFDHRLSLRERLGYALAPHDPIAAAQLFTQAEGGYAWTVATDGMDFLRSINYCPASLPPRSPMNILDRAARVSILVNRQITASVSQGVSPKSRLQGNPVPVLYIRGLCDFPIPQSTIREYATLFPNLRLVQLQNVSHKLWNAPNTEQVAPTILAFLNNQPTLPLPTVSAQNWIVPPADRYNQK
ncbi:alpha/beta hydrolase [Phormidium tenue FACHB-886]|nr:alpha/beta hydrolase [Phormidium tenue FACHB-886]